MKDEPELTVVKNKNRHDCEEAKGPKITEETPWQDVIKQKWNGKKTEIKSAILTNFRVKVMAQL